MSTTASSSYGRYKRLLIWKEKICFQRIWWPKKKKRKYIIQDQPKCIQYIVGIAASSLEKGEVQHGSTNKWRRLFTSLRFLKAVRKKPRSSRRFSLSNCWKHAGFFSPFKWWVHQWAISNLLKEYKTGIDNQFASSFENIAFVDWIEL